MKTARPIYLFIMFFLSGPMFSQDLGNIKNAKPFTLHGNLGLNLMAYSVSGITDRQQPFSYVLSANATASIYSIDLPFSFTYSDRQRSYAQPFNQFGLSPHWKWITVHGGYRNVTFSEYTLSGHTFLGGGVELNPGIFRFGFVYGRFNKSTTGNPESVSDTLPTYKRMGFAAKIGLGKDKNFFELIFLRIRDDSTSVNQPDTITQQFPEQNIVTGFNSRFTIAKKLTWETEAAFSLLTNNLTAQPVLDSTANPTLVDINNFLVINQSSEYHLAIKSFLQYKAKNWSVKLQYKRIDPNFQSMGAYYFNSDIENITLSPAFSMFKRKLFLSGSVGLQRDNLSKTKMAATSRTIGNVNISLNLSEKFGFDASYGNLSFNQKAGNIPLNDTARMEQSNHNLSIMPRLMFFNEKRSHMIMLSYNMSMLYDKNEFTSAYNYYDSHTGQVNYILGLLESGWSFTFGLTYLNFYTCQTSNNETGGTFGASKSFFDNKLSFNWNNSLMRSVFGSEKGWVLNSNPSGDYQLNRHHSARLNIYFTGNYTDPGSVNKSFNEFKGELSYVFTF
jgi:hypothetical protein